MRTSTYYDLGANAAFRDLGFEKNAAGFRDAMRVALTGRVPLRHGTSPSRAAGILERGLQPGALPGVSAEIPGLDDVQKGLAFLTRNKGNANNYASQQAGLEQVPRMREEAAQQLHKFRERVAPLVERFAPQHSERLTAALDTVGGMAQGAPALHVARVAKLPGQTLEARVPRQLVRAQEAQSPEAGKVLETLRSADMPEGTARALAGTPFMGDVIMKGGLDPKYIKGSPAYQGVTLPELRDHAKSVFADPGEYVKDIGRAFTGVSHRPGAIPLREP